MADIFEVPLAFLMDGANHQRLSYVLPAGGRRRFGIGLRGVAIVGRGGHRGEQRVGVDEGHRLERRGRGR